MATNNVVLHVEDQGASDGLPLVFSNSLGTDFRIWNAVLPLLPPGLRIIRYDKRGHGLSDCPAGPYTIDDHRQDLEGVLDQLDVKAAVIVGLSVGGLIGQALASARPDLVKALVLCDTSHKIGTAEMWNPRIEAIKQGGIAALSEVILERWFSAAFRKEQSDNLTLWRAMLTRTPAAGYVATCEAIRDADLTNSSRHLDLPTICIAGSEDQATPPAVVRSTAELIGGPFVEIAGAGHLPCVDAPETLAGIINDFLRENRFV